MKISCVGYQAQSVQWKVFGSNLFFAQ